MQPITTPPPSPRNSTASGTALCAADDAVDLLRAVMLASACCRHLISGAPDVSRPSRGTAWKSTHQVARKEGHGALAPQPDPRTSSYPAMQLSDKPIAAARSGLPPVCHEAIASIHSSSGPFLARDSPSARPSCSATGGTMHETKTIVIVGMCRRRRRR